MVSLVGVNKRFVKGKETITIFDHLGLIIPRGTFVAVMGPPAPGKTTLLNLVAASTEPTRARSAWLASASTGSRAAGGSLANARGISASSSSSTTCCRC